MTPEKLKRLSIYGLFAWSLLWVPQFILLLFRNNNHQILSDFLNSFIPKVAIATMALFGEIALLFSAMMMIFLLFKGLNKQSVLLFFLVVITFFVNYLNWSFIGAIVSA